MDMGSPTDLPDSATTTSPPESASAQPPQETSQTPAGLSDEATTSSSNSLEAILNSLQDRLDELAGQLDSAQTTAKEFSTLKGQVQSDLNQAKKLATSYESAVSETDAAVEGAQTAYDHAEALIGTLDEDDVENLKNAIRAINDEYQAKVDAYNAAKNDLTSHQDAGDAADADVAAKQHAFDAASEALSGLSADIKELASPLKSLARDLTAAVDAGQPLKAYVLRSELEATMSRLQGLTSSDHLDALVSAYSSAQGDLANARKAKSDNALALAGKKAAVASAKAVLDKAKTTRKDKLAERYVLSSDTSPAAKPA
jgi:chromosome segregation ATPase